MVRGWPSHEPRMAMPYERWAGPLAARAAMAAVARMRVDVAMVTSVMRAVREAHQWRSNPPHDGGGRRR